MCLPLQDETADGSVIKKEIFFFFATLIELFSLSFTVLIMLMLVQSSSLVRWSTLLMGGVLSPQWVREGSG